MGILRNGGISAHRTIFPAPHILDNRKNGACKTDMNIKELSRLAEGEAGRVREIRVSDREKQRLQDLGLIRGTLIRRLYRSFSGDPVAYEFRGAVFALRNTTAGQITVEPEPGRNTWD